MQDAKTQDMKREGRRRKGHENTGQRNVARKNIGRKSRLAMLRVKTVGLLGAYSTDDLGKPATDDHL